MIPDIEALTRTYLDARPEISGMSARVTGETPRSTAQPWVRITQLDPKAVTPNAEERLVNFMVQLDCYAGEGGQAEASLLTRRVRQALTEMRLTTHSGAVVSDVQFGSCPRLPDTDFEPTRQRYVLTAMIYAHWI